MKAYINAALDETPANVKATKGIIDKVVAFNPSADTEGYLKVYDSTDAANTTAPTVAQIGVEGGQTVVVPGPFTCATGIRIFATVTAATGAQTAPDADFVVTIWYR